MIRGNQNLGISSFGIIIQRNTGEGVRPLFAEQDELVILAKFHIGRDRDIEIVPGKLQAGRTPRRCPDISKLAAPGHRPRVPLAVGLKPTLDWYWNNADLAPKEK